MSESRLRWESDRDSLQQLILHKEHQTVAITSAMSALINQGNIRIEQFQQKAFDEVNISRSHFEPDLMQLEKQMESKDKDLQAQASALLAQSDQCQRLQSEIEQQTDRNNRLELQVCVVALM